MKTETIIEDAEIAATYFRGLVDKGVPVHAAITLTGQYVQGVQLMRAAGQEPKEPWKP